MDSDVVSGVQYLYSGWGVVNKNHCWRYIVFGYAHGNRPTYPYSDLAWAKIVSFRSAGLVSSFVVDFPLIGRAETLKAETVRLKRDAQRIGQRSRSRDAIKKSIGVST